MTVEGIDRMYLNVDVPRLQCTHGAVSFFRERGQPLASSVLMAPMSRGFVSELDRFAARHRLSVILFAKGQRKDDVMAEPPAYTKSLQSEPIRLTPSHTLPHEGRGLFRALPPP
jgi:hypothetical protein